MSKEIVLPELGEGIDKATVACWHYSVGDTVGQDDDVVEVVTQKAAFNVPADAAGILKEIRVAEGQEIGVGGILAVIQT